MRGEFIGAPVPTQMSRPIRSLNKSIIANAILWLLSMVPVSATIVFIQPSSLTAGASASDEDQGQFIGDNFSLGSPETIRSVTWYGVYLGADTPLTDAFTIAFFDDNSSAAPQVSPF